jgi:nitroreductase
MDTQKTILERRSVRAYKTDPVPAEHLRQILEAGRWAASAGNRQPWRFVVVGEPEQKARLARVCGDRPWLADVPYILVAVGLPEQSEMWYKVDTAIAMETIMLAARNLGYGTCWLASIDREGIKAVCGIPSGADVLACTPLGVPEAWPEPRERKPLAELFSSERFDGELAL